MAQTSVNFRMDADLKESVEEICRKMGMNLTTAITIFCTKVAQERRIPFEITADPDPFYSESNIRYLEKKMEDYKAGRLKFAEHELIEEQGDYARRNPFEGIGKPEPLKENLSGFWSRRIDGEHRIVYAVENDVVVIIACRGHYK